MSELPDASFGPVGDERLDQLADLPPIPTTGRASSRAPSMSPRKAARRSSRAPSLQPNGASSKPASRAGSRAPSLGPVPNLAPSSAAKEHSSRRSSRAPSLGPDTAAAAAAPSSPMPVTQETTTIIEETVTRPRPAVAFTGGGSTFAVPDETDDSSFFGQNLGTSPTQAEYPEFHTEGGDESFEL
jgi:hypothetical protein